MAGDQGPLSGVRVLDFGKLLPGPWCTQVLADMGADVIKVEQPPQGDPARYNPPVFRQDSAYFHSLNGSKRSIALNLSVEAEREIARKLIARTDVLVESFRNGVSERLGIDWDSAQQLNPRLIYCSISGFGRTGPWAGIPGHDLVVQAATGILGIVDEGETPPTPAFQAADYAAATTAAIGILAALRKRDMTGEGTRLDVSMFDCMFAMSNIVGGSALTKAAGHDRPQRMEVFGHNPRYAIYLAADAKAVAVSLLETGIWAHFCRLIGRPELISAQESLSDRLSRHPERADVYRSAIAGVCASKPRDELVAWLGQHDVPILPVLSPDEALASPHVQARGMMQWVDHPVEGRIPVYANPLHLSGVAPIPRAPAPAMDADRASILAELDA